MRFFTSDLHFGHANVINYCLRPFKDVAHMNGKLVELWNNQVQPEDEVYVLGDFSLNKKWAINLAPELNGRKILISGNHDATFMYHSNSGKTKRMIQKYLDVGWAEIHQTKVITLSNGTEVLLSHLPYGTKESLKFDDRYQEYRPIDTKPLLCGHVHQGFVKLGKSINVGCDAHNFRFLTDEDVIKLIEDPREFIPVKLTLRQKIKKLFRKIYD